MTYFKADLFVYGAMAQMLECWITNPRVLRPKSPGAQGPRSLSSWGRSVKFHKLLVAYWLK